MRDAFFISPFYPLMDPLTEKFPFNQTFRVTESILQERCEAAPCHRFFLPAPARHAQPAISAKEFYNHYLSQTTE